MINKINIIKKYTEDIRALFGTHLKAVILYGSQARGDYGVDSDFDIMILTDIERSDISDYQNKVYELDYEYNWDYDIEIHALVENEQFFNSWVDAYPFYNNIKIEGVNLYAA